MLEGAPARPTARRQRAEEAIAQPRARASARIRSTMRSGSWPPTSATQRVTPSRTSATSWTSSSAS
eukprot:1694790-Pyramimonas_sp.AAC.1